MFEIDGRWAIQESEIEAPANKIGWRAAEDWVRDKYDIVNTTGHENDGLDYARKREIEIKSTLKTHVNGRPGRFIFRFGQYTRALDVDLDFIFVVYEVVNRNPHVYYMARDVRVSALDFQRKINLDLKEDAWTSTEAHGYSYEEKGVCWHRIRDLLDD